MNTINPDGEKRGVMQYSEALSVFSSYLESNKRTPESRKRYSPGTVEKYYESCQYFGEFLRCEFSDVNEDVSQITPRHLLAYQEYLQNKLSVYSGEPLRERTVNVRMEIAKAICKHLHLIDVIPKDPCRGIIISIPTPADPSKMDGVLTLEEFQKRVKNYIEGSAGQRTYESMRNITLCRLLFATGLRIRATLGIKRKDIDIEKNSVKVVEKGGRTCTRFFDSETAGHITRLLEHMDNHLPGLKYPHLFITRKAKRIQGKTQPTYSQMSYPLARLAVRRVVGVSPHMLRHSFALACVEKGVDPFTLMNLMGHANVATTSIYTRKNEEMMKKDYGKYAPFG